MRDRKPKDYTGLKYNRLTALYLHSYDKPKPPKWAWRCDCGNIVIVTAKLVVKQNTKSCGCLFKELLIKRNTKHGLSKLHDKTYRSWKDMRARCYSKNNHDYKNYGARGISVCERWNDFANFFADMGERPEGKTLDRIDVNKNYEPSNCRWADNETQANNKQSTIKVVYNNELISATQLARKINKSSSTVIYRLTHGLEPSFLGDYRK